MPCTVTMIYKDRLNGGEVARDSFPMPWDLDGPLSDQEDVSRSRLLCAQARMRCPDHLELDEVGDYDERERTLEVWVRVPARSAGDDEDDHDPEERDRAAIRAEVSSRCGGLTSSELRELDD